MYFEHKIKIHKGIVVVYEYVTEPNQFTYLKANGEKTFSIYNEFEEQVGFLQYTGGTIVQIDIFPEHRRSGYALASTLLFCDFVQETTRYSKVRTTAVVSPAYQYILEQLEFKPTDDPNSNTFYRSLESFDISNYFEPHPTHSTLQ